MYFQKTKYFPSFCQVNFNFSFQATFCSQEHLELHSRSPGNVYDVWSDLQFTPAMCTCACTSRNCTPFNIHLGKQTQPALQINACLKWNPRADVSTLMPSRGNRNTFWSNHRPRVLNLVGGFSLPVCRRGSKVRLRLFVRARAQQPHGSGRDQDTPWEHWVQCSGLHQSAAPLSAPPPRFSLSAASDSDCSSHSRTPPRIRQCSMKSRCTEWLNTAVVAEMVCLFPKQSPERHLVTFSWQAEQFHTLNSQNDENLKKTEQQ